MTGERTRVVVRPIQTDDLERVADLLGRAFDDDPAINHIVKQDARRAARVRHMMSVGLKKLTFPFGETYVTEGFEGAALWNPPGHRPHGLFNDLKLIPDLLRLAGISGVRRAIAVLDMLEKKHPKEPHYYLMAIGVDPPRQGQGIGSGMLQPMMERLDAERMPSYLESSKERNVPLYERHGYEVVERVELPHDGPSAWLMWRQPR